jgi:hypothetical protein
MPPDLLAAREFTPDDLTFLSTGDPFAAEGGGPFPSDGSIPTYRPIAPMRISFSYLYAFRSAGLAEVPDWTAARFDPRVGLLANEWQGSVRPGDNFTAEVAGQVQRITTDGSLATIRRGGPKALGDLQDLFFAR